jgi:hypothetical protein
MESEQKYGVQRGIMSADRPKFDDEKGANRPEPIEKDFQMRIDKDGQWFHEGSLIKRSALVVLFSSVLSCDEAGQHWLRTPVEFGKIEVEDAAFVIIAAEIKGKGEGAEIKLTDNVERVHLLSSTHPLIFRGSPLAPFVLQPYIQLEKGLLAKLSRPVYYQLASYVAEEDGSGLYSDGSYFAFPLEEGAQD